MNASIDLEIRKGSTFSKMLRWGAGGLVYASIDSVDMRAPLRVVAPGHGVPDGWVVKLESLDGTRGLPVDTWMPAARVDADTLEFRSVNGSDARGSYTGGGYVVFAKPVDMTDYDARMQIREYMRADEALVELSVTNGGIVIDTDLSAVMIRMDAAQTAAIDWRSGVYDLELVAPDGTVTALSGGAVTVCNEVTR